MKPPAAKKSRAGNLATALVPLRARWQALSARERYLSTLATSAVGLLLVWAVALAPALRTLQKVQTQRVALDAQMQQMLALQAEARQLEALPRISREVAVKALQEAVAALGSGAQMQVSGERAVVTLRGVPAVSLAAWIGQVRTNARVAPVEARLVRSAARAAAPAANAPVGQAFGQQAGAPPGTPPMQMPMSAPAPAPARPRTNDDIRWDGTLVVALPAG